MIGRATSVLYGNDNKRPIYNKNKAECERNLTFILHKINSISCHPAAPRVVKQVVAAPQPHERLPPRPVSVQCAFPFRSCPVYVFVYSLLTFLSLASTVANGLTFGQATTCTLNRSLVNLVCQHSVVSVNMKTQSYTIACM